MLYVEKVLHGLKRAAAVYLTLNLAALVHSSKRIEQMSSYRGKTTSTEIWIFQKVDLNYGFIMGDIHKPTKSKPLKLYELSNSPTIYHADFELRFYA